MAELCCYPGIVCILTSFKFFEMLELLGALLEWGPVFFVELPNVMSFLLIIFKLRMLFEVVLVALVW